MEVGMIEILNRKNIFIFMFVFFSMGNVRGNSMDNNIWSFLELLRKEFIMPVDKFSEITGVKVNLEYYNEFTIFYRAEGVKLSENINIGSIDLRANGNELHFPSILSFDISGRCITLNDIKDKFSHLEIVDYPGGHSLNDVTTYATKNDSHGVRLGFSFAEKNPDCLARVVIRK